MATQDFLHGVETLSTAVSQPLVSVDLSTIGLIGTAPGADPAAFPLNTPVLVSGSDAVLVGKLVSQLPAAQGGTPNLNPSQAGTLPMAVSTILDECSPVMVVVRVEEGSSESATIANIMGGVDAQGNYTGVHAFQAAEAITGRRPRLLCAPGWSHQSVAEALVSIQVAEGGSGYTPGLYHLTITDSAGTGAQASATVDSTGKVASVTLLSNGAGYKAPSFALPAAAGQGTGASFSASIATIDNGVVAELKTIAEKLRAVIFADSADQGQAAAIAAAAMGGGRVMLIDPWIVRDDGTGTSVTFPASGKFAAKQAYLDQAVGFWRSVSNQPLNGVTALSRPIGFVVSDQSCAANLLNAAYVSTIIRQAGRGYTTWGNRALDGSFLCVTRTVDEVNETLLQSVLQFVDMNIVKNFVTEVVEAVNAYLRQLKSKGAITGGKCWADTALNTPEAVMNGQVFFDFDIGPAYPAERITFRSAINNDYVTTIFNNGSAA
ncbi:phage tail sheath C-terminal domain-containing protein [Formicincola oecophyllae]|nr:phage tail sheath C-terminal domain-containing protein [Formicincola oecophyllae]